jgi:hypothetical protein
VPPGPVRILGTCASCYERSFAGAHVGKGAALGRAEQGSCLGDPAWGQKPGFDHAASPWYSWIRRQAGRDGGHPEDLLEASHVDCQRWRKTECAMGAPAVVARQGLLAQPTKKPRPMAGVPAERLSGLTHVATHVSPMSRLKTMARPEGTGHTPPTIVIEGVDDMVEVLLAA